MSLPETIRWCQRHEGASSDCERKVYDEMCSLVEVELHPVGTRVAGPDDLLIRREDGGVWQREAIESIEFAFHDDPNVPEFVESLLDALARALAAAEGGET